MLVKMNFKMFFAVSLDDLQQHPETHIKLKTINEERSADILLNNVCSGFETLTVHFDADLEGSLAEKFRQLLKSRKHMNTSSPVHGSRLQYPQNIIFLLNFLALPLFIFTNIIQTQLIKHSLLKHPIQSFLRYIDLNKIILDSQTLGPGFLIPILLKIISYKLQYTLLYLTLLLPEVNHKRSRNIGANRIRIASSHISVNFLLISYLRLTLQIVINHIGSILNLIDFWQMILM